MNMDLRMVRYDAIVIGSGAAGGMAAKSVTDGSCFPSASYKGPTLTVMA
jgi:choline dehydrogenase-like flavoprotein